MLNERTMNIFEENDITVHDREQQNGEFYREIEFYSNAGEDVIEIVWYDGTEEGFIKAFRQLADDFDVNDHAAMYIGDRGNHGIPDSVRELIDDAEEIKETLLIVADELETVGRKKHTFNVSITVSNDEEEEVIDFEIDAYSLEDAIDSIRNDLDI